MVDLKRRGFLGLLAAPAVISIAGKLSPSLWMPPPLVMNFNPLIDVVPRPADMWSMAGTDFCQRFHEIVEPVLREHFEKVYLTGEGWWQTSYQGGSPKIISVSQRLRLRRAIPPSV